MQHVPADKPDSLVKGVLVGIFFCLFIWNFLHWLPRDMFGDGLSIWVYTDWLIDYSAGFIRRGLSGELLDMLRPLAEPRIVIALLTWSIFCVAVLGYIRSIARSFRQLSPFALTALLFLPSLLPFYLYDHEAFGRKEVLGFLILLWHLRILEVGINAESIELPSAGQYLRRILPVVLLLLPVHVLMHETAFLLFVPAHALITNSVLILDASIGRRRRLSYLMLLYFPVLSVFSALYFFGRLDMEAALSICTKWEVLGALEPGACSLSGRDTMWDLPGSLTTLPWTIPQAASLTLTLPAGTVLAWIAVCAVMGYSTAYCGGLVARLLAGRDLSRGADAFFAGRHSMRMQTRYLLFPLLLALPLYILGWDIGRWFAVACINFMMIALSREINHAECALGRSNEETGRASRVPYFKPRVSWLGWLFLLIVTFFIRLPHCCYNEFNIFSQPLRSLLGIIARLP